MWKKFFDSYYWVLPIGVGCSSIWFVIELALLLFTERNSVYFIVAVLILVNFATAMLVYDHLESKSKKPPD